eukprot:2496972-Amphidinium_carterae.1
MALSACPSEVRQSSRGTATRVLQRVADRYQTLSLEGKAEHMRACKLHTTYEKETRQLVLALSLAGEGTRRRDGAQLAAGNGSNALRRGTMRTGVLISKTGCLQGKVPRWFALSLRSCDAM